MIKHFFKELSEAEIQFEPIQLVKIGAAFPFRVLYKASGDEVSIMPVCYIKLNHEKESISSVFANFSVKGSRMQDGERVRL